MDHVHQPEHSPVLNFMASALLGEVPIFDAERIGTVASRHLCFEKPDSDDVKDISDERKARH